MSEENPMHLPLYDDFVESLAVLSLTISVSELHGMMCGYLCAGDVEQGEAYMRALLGNKKDEASRKAALSMFSVFSISQHQISEYNFGLELLLPDDEEPLLERAEAFSEWCDGFVQSLTSCGIELDEFSEEDAQEALQHIIEFAELDTQSLEVDDEDESALMEVTEYTRMAILRLHGDLVSNARQGGQGKTTH